MNNHPAFSNTGHYAQYYSSTHSSPQHLAPYSSPAASPYQPSQNTMSQSASAYYQQQSYPTPTPVQSNLPTPMPASYAYQGFAPHSAHGSLPQAPSVIPHSQSGYPPAQQQTYAGYGSSSSSAASPGLYPQYPEHGLGHGIPTSYAHQRHSSSSTVLSSSPSSQSSSQSQPQSHSSSDRFPCPSCDKSFTRNFDRKRHMEIHLPGSAGSNRCRFCHKDYSRPDSLKRHLDNGCDKKPHS